MPKILQEHPRHLHGRPAEPWTLELVKSAEQMDRQRLGYVNKLKDLLSLQLPDSGAWPSAAPLEVEYLRGWDEDLGLYEQVQRDLPRDRRPGAGRRPDHRGCSRAGRVDDHR